MIMRDGLFLLKDKKSSYDLFFNLMLATVGNRNLPKNKVLRFVTIKQKKGGNRMSYKVSIVIENDEYGYYAYSPELEGCQTQGNSLEEVIANIKEAIELYLETLSEDERKEYLSKEILTTTLEVQVA